MKRIKVHPPKDFFVAFLNTRGIPIVAEDPEVVHYFGSSYREIKRIIKEDSPDLVVIHHAAALENRKQLPFIFIYDEISDEQDIYRSNKKIITNAPGLAKVYYKALALDREIVDITPPAVNKEKNRISGSNIISKLFRIMMWR